MGSGEMEVMTWGRMGNGAGQTVDISSTWAPGMRNVSRQGKSMPSRGTSL